ncbi:acetyl-CoA carboxylase biotin carboxyl carrier protein [Kroppenstedtia eburnea]|uniref:Biotin carboxyl carrier protein of acetyl-CoA carboxylase n=2 Tax=Kroppenstedtia eburnea TaxID=714067 RepID=A0A1N7ILF4_9BACL|nr:acetyl-CoA carboxylase biotin carboxyl carrier protein [Kroppenstedtia eburnea]
MPMKMHELRELIRLVDESKIEEFELENDGTKVLIKKALSDRQAVAIDSPAEVRPVEPEQGNRVEAAPAPVPATEAISPQQAPAATGEEETDLHKIVSPMVGTFYRAPSPDSDPYVKDGSRVDEKTVVCIVEAMKLMNEIEAEVRGEIVKVLVENGQLVEYGQPLFLVKAD